MLIKILGDVGERIAGKPARNIVESLMGKSNVNEFLIAKKLALTINQTRNILYRLSDFGVVSFIRKKDKKKGWYTYFWTLNVLKTLELGKKGILHETDQLNKLLNSREKKRFYKCDSCEIEVSEETALLQNFTCVECGEVYDLSESHEIINEIKNRLSKLEEDLKVVDEEVKKESNKIGRKIILMEKKEKQKRKELREKRAKERRKEKEGKKQKTKKKGPSKNKTKKRKPGKKLKSSKKKKNTNKKTEKKVKKSKSTSKKKRT